MKLKKFEVVELVNGNKATILETNNNQYYLFLFLIWYMILVINYYDISELLIIFTTWK